MIPINKRKIVLCIFLSIITFGIYLLYWEYLLVKNTRAIQKDDSGCAGEVLCLFLVPVYPLYWWYTRGKIVKERSAEYGYSTTGNGVLYLILCLIGLDIVELAIMQYDFNKLPFKGVQANQKSTSFARQTIVKRNSPFSEAGKRIKKSKYLILMIIPAIIYYLVFCYYPMYGVLIAFKRFLPSKGILLSPWADHYGLKNFEYIFQDEKFWQVLGNTVFIGVSKIIISFVAAITVSLLINEIRMRVFKKTVQIIVTFPHFLSWVIVGGLVANIFGTTGIVNNIIAATGGEKVRFLADGNFFLGLIFSSDVWKEAGWSSIIYLATMAGISPELYEAADIDGATRLQKIFNITLPAIKPTAILLLILSVGGVLSAGFDQILNMYNPLVYNVADILDTYIYRSTLREMQPAERGAAIGLFKSVVSFLLVLLVDRIAKLCGERGII